MYFAYLLGLALIQRDPVASTRALCCSGRDSSSEIPSTPALCKNIITLTACMYVHLVTQYHITGNFGVDLIWRNGQKWPEKYIGESKFGDR